MSRLLWWALMTEIEMMTIQFSLCVSKRSHGLSVCLKCAIEMLNTFARSLIIESILSKLIVMLPHDTNISDAFLLALSLIRIISSLKRQFCNGFHYWASGWCSNVPASQA